MAFKPEEVSAVLEQELERYESRLKMESVGTVLQVGDGIARVWGLDDVMAGELVLFPGDITGVVLNLEEDNVGIALFGSTEEIKQGDEVRRTGRLASVPVGDAMAGRVINAIGQPIDGKGPIVTDKANPIEGRAPGVVDRQPVNQPVQTGLKAIDSMIPIGRGQRELIIGDRQTGKTAAAITRAGGIAGSRWTTSTGQATRASSREAVEPSPRRRAASASAPPMTITAGRSRSASWAITRCGEPGSQWRSATSPARRRRSSWRASSASGAAPKS
jgi:hypothetical protein